MANTVLDGDLLQIQPWWSFQEQAGTCVLHYIVEPGSAAVEDKEIADALLGTWQGECQDVIGGGVFFRGITVRILRPAQTFPTVLSNSVNLEGTLAGPPLPGQCSGLITKRTDDGSRRGRGRSYIPFPPASANGADGNPTAEYVNAIEAWGAQVFDTNTIVGGAGSCIIKPVVANRPIPGLVKPIISYVGRFRWATQRRRGDYGAPNVSPFQ